MIRAAALALILTAGTAVAAIPDWVADPVWRPAAAAPVAAPSRPADLLAAADPITVSPSRPGDLLAAEPAAPADQGPLNLAITDFADVPDQPVVTQGPAMLLAMMSPPAPSRPAGLVPGGLTVLSLSTSAAIPVPVAPQIVAMERRLSRQAAPLPLTLALAGVAPPILRPLEQGDGGIILAAALAPLAPLSRPVISGAAITEFVAAPTRPSLAIAEELVAASRIAFVANPVSLSPMAIARMVLPTVRPEGFEPPVAELIPVAASVTPQASGGGNGLCGDGRLSGEYLGSVPGSGACGVENAALVRSVGGIRLSEPATVTCDTARALASWVDNAVLPQLGRVEVIETMGSYSCRGRNGQAGARLSEHAFGHAIDIGGFRLANGDRITVLNNWGSGAAGRALAAMHRVACGIFGTVLGPEANAYHRNHFHFDTASYRSGSYCE